MWVPSKVLDWFQISKDTVSSLREEVAALRAESVTLRAQLTVSQVNFDWLRMRYNQLEYERTALLEKAYNIKLPSPEIVVQPKVDPIFNPKDFSFEDMGEDLAQKLGLPTYAEPRAN